MRETPREPCRLTGAFHGRLFDVSDAYTVVSSVAKMAYYSVFLILNNEKQIGDTRVPERLYRILQDRSQSV